MELLKTIENDLRNAIKDKRESEMSTLRMLKSDIMYEKAKSGDDLSDEKIIEVLSRASKRRRESIEEFTKAGRKDLADREAVELSIIEKYLPRQMAAEEIEKIIDEKIAQEDGATRKDFGRIMGLLMKELKGQADGAVVKEILNRKLENS